MIYRELLLGCGHTRDKRLWMSGQTAQWRGLVTLDHSPRAKPDVLCDLDVYPWGHNLSESEALNAPPNYLDYLRIGVDWWAFGDDVFDEIHAYEVLEHLGGGQGDYRGFFRCFQEIWRILKPNGYLFATCPSRYSDWLWGDPGHTRAVLPANLTFLSQPNYTSQVGVTAMSDYRDEFSADFDIVRSDESAHQNHYFILRAVKPSRITDAPTS